MANSILILGTKAPYGNEDIFAGERLSLAMLASGLIGRSTVLLVGDGALNAVATQEPAAVDMPSNIEAANDLADFEGEIYVVGDDLKERVGDMPVIPSIKVISWDKARELILDHDVITTF
jgi:tRNA 2-thiouridine synthesizing protein C